MSTYADTLAGAGPGPSFETSVPPLDPPPEDAAPKSHKRRRIVVGSVAFVMIFGGAFLGAQALMQEDEKPTIIGAFTLKDDGDTEYGITKTSIFSHEGKCQGSGGYSDISENTQVKISDQDGKPLAVTHLGEGSPGEKGFSTGASAWVKSCTFGWSASDLPKSDFYVIEVGRRGELTYSYDDLEGQAWIVSTSLGD